jgi:hypothetical protein
MQKVSTKELAASGVLAQNIDSNASGAREINLMDIVKHCTSVSVKGSESNLRLRTNLNRSKVRIACFSEWKSRAGVEQVARVPAEIADAIEAMLNELQQALITSQFRGDNILSYSRRPVHKAKTNSFAMRHNLVSEDAMLLQDQLMVCKWSLGDVEHRLAADRLKFSEDNIRIVNLKKNIAALTTTKLYLEACISNLSKQTPMPSTPVS